jgi:hypothetical protein
MSELSPEARALIDETRHSEGLTPTQRARIRSALVVQMGAGAAVSTGASIGAASTAAKVAGGASFTVAMATKAVATIAIVGAIGTGGLSVALHGWPHREPARSSQTARPPEAAWSSQTARPPEAAWSGDTPRLAVPHEEPARAVSPTELPSPVAPPSERHIAPSRAAAATSHVSPAVVSVPPSSLESETRLLRDASFELGAGRPERALALLDEHASSFSGGALVEEGSVERILALCALGRTSAAHDEGARFLRERPHSLLADRVRASCGGHATDGSDEP